MPLGNRLLRSVFKLTIICGLTFSGAAATANSKKVADGLTEKKLIFDLSKPKEMPRVSTGAKAPSAISSAPILLGETEKSGSSTAPLSEKPMLLEDGKKAAGNKTKSNEPKNAVVDAQEEETSKNQVDDSAAEPAEDEDD